MQPKKLAFRAIQQAATGNHGTGGTKFMEQKNF